MIQDITERYLAEQSLRLNQRAVDSISNGVEIIDAIATDYPIKHVNAAFEKMTGYFRSELLGTSYQILSKGRIELAALQEIQLAAAHVTEGDSALHH